MGNENKINEIVQRSKELFLPDELKPDEQQHVYSLNEEFARSRKNRSFFFVVKVLLFLVLIAGITYLLSIGIERFRGEAQVEFTEFEDLRLRDLFDNAGRYQTELGNAREELNDLRIRMQDDILNVKNASSRDREAVLARHLPQNETDAKIAKILEREEARIKEVKAEYQRKIVSREAKIRELNGKIEELNKDMKVNVQKAESIMGNYQQLHTIKMERQKAAYEREITELKEYHRRYVESLVLKYNPVFKSTKIQEILGTGGDGAVIPFLAPYNEMLEKERAFTRSDFDRLRKNFENYTILMERMLQIPYENSVPPTLGKLNFLTRKLADSYEKLWVRLVSVIDRKNGIIQNYRHAFEYYGSLHPENGFIIDPRRKDAVRVQLAKIHAVKTGDTGLVFRDDDEYIGKIEFTVSETDITAKVVELAESKKLQPFDKILISYKKEQP